MNANFDSLGEDTPASSHGMGAPSAAGWDDVLPKGNGLFETLLDTTGISEQYNRFIQAATLTSSVGVYLFLALLVLVVYFTLREWWKASWARKLRRERYRHTMGG